MTLRFDPHILAAGLATLIVVAASAALSDSGQAQPAATNGKDLFAKRCGGCHALDRDKEGPRLGKVYGRGVASVPSFEYSESLRRSKVTWTEETLDSWLADPEKLIPGTDMSFQIERPDERAAIIAYLRQISSE